MAISLRQLHLGRVLRTGVAESTSGVPYSDNEEEKVITRSVLLTLLDKNPSSPSLIIPFVTGNLWTNMSQKALSLQQNLNCQLQGF